MSTPLKLLLIGIIPFLFNCDLNQKMYLVISLKIQFI